MKHTEMIKPWQAAVIAILSLSGCALVEPQAVRLQTAHYSHLTAGRSNEDGLTVVELVARWERGPIYVELGEGVNIKGRNGGGFYGPSETSSFKFGYEWRKD